jgi:hypothetical protein
MKTTTSLTLAFIAAPMALFAQQATASAAASSQASVNVPVTYSAESKASIEASFKRARDRNLPDQTMRDRIAEAQAKGATDAQVAASVQKAESRLEASQSVLVKAGRANPTPDEVTNGAQAMERGATEAQVTAVVAHPPTNVSIAAALDGLARVTGAPEGAGVSVTGAVQGAVSGVLPPKKP